MFQNRLKAVAGGLAAAFLVAGCGGSATTSGGSTAAKSTVVIGVIDDLTGAAASIGVLDKNASQLAVDKINKAGGANGHPLKLVFYDNKSDPALTATLATRLITQDGAVLISCCASSTATAAAAQVAGQLHVPMLTSAVQQSLTADSQPWKGYVYRVALDNNSLAKFNVDFIKTKGWKRIALDTSSLSYGTDSIPFFKSYVGQTGGTIVTEVSLPATISDASVQAAQILQAKPDVVLSWDYPVPVAQLTKALRAAGSQVPIVSNWSAINPTMSSVAGTTIPELYAHDAVIPTKGAVQDYVKGYQAAYGQPPTQTFQATFGYAHIQVAAAAVAAAKTDDAAGVRTGLQGLKCVKTLVGTENACITYGANNYEGAHQDPASFLIMKALKGGDWVPAT